MTHPSFPSFSTTPSPAVQHVGGFRVHGNNLIISDVVDTQKIKDVAAGKWFVFFERVNAFGQEHVGSVMVVHEQMNQPTARLEWQDVGLVVGVDIGSVAIFDDTAFVPATANEDDHATFRSLWNASITSSTERGIGVVGRGCFVESGAGNGNFRCWKVEVGGKVVAVYIDFACDVSECVNDRQNQFATEVTTQRLVKAGWATGEAITLSVEAMRKVWELVNEAPRPCEGLRAAAARQREARLAAPTTPTTKLRRGQRVRISRSPTHCAACEYKEAMVHHWTGVVTMTHETHPDLIPDGWHQVHHDCGARTGVKRADLELEKHPPSLLFPHPTHIGTFHVAAGELTISDMLSRQGISNVTYGKWHVFLERERQSVWGERNASMTLVHHDLLHAADCPSWEEMYIKIIVETGAVVVFDGDQVAHTPKSMWARMWVLGEKDGGFVAGDGALVHSPWTEGRYRMEKMVLGGGKVVALRIDFASDTSDDTVTKFGRDVNERRQQRTPPLP